MLECDMPLPRTKERFGGYGGVFEYLLKSGARALNDPSLNPDTGFEITKWPVEQDPSQYPKLEDIDAILITGSSTSTLSLPPSATTNRKSKNTTRSPTTHGPISSSTSPPQS